MLFDTDTTNVLLSACAHPTTKGSVDQQLRSPFEPVPWVARAINLLLVSLSVPVLLATVQVMSSVPLLAKVRIPCSTRQDVKAIHVLSMPAEAFRTFRRVPAPCISSARQRHGSDVAVVPTEHIMSPSRSRLRCCSCHSLCRAARPRRGSLQTESAYQMRTHRRGLENGFKNLSQTPEAEVETSEGAPMWSTVNNESTGVLFGRG